MLYTARFTNSLKHAHLWVWLIFFSFSVNADGAVGCTPTLIVHPRGGTESASPADGLSYPSGTAINFYVENSSSCYWVIFWKDSNGNVFNISPNHLLHEYGVYANTSSRFRLPSGANQSFTLDNMIGTEIIILMGRDKPFADLSMVGRTIAKSSTSQLHSNLSVFGSQLLIQEIGHD